MKVSAFYAVVASLLEGVLESIYVEVVWTPESVGTFSVIRKYHQIGIPNLVFPEHSLTHTDYANPNTLTYIIMEIYKWRVEVIVDLKKT
jgi:hypothetical protein